MFRRPIFTIGTSERYVEHVGVVLPAHRKLGQSSWRNSFPFSLPYPPTSSETSCVPGVLMREIGTRGSFFFFFRWGMGEGIIFFVFSTALIIDKANSILQLSLHPLKF